MKIQLNPGVEARLPVGVAAPRESAAGLSRSNYAFTLLEVMIAMGIFFMAIFAILAVVSTSLRNARLLQKHSVDPGMLLAELSLTNKFYEGMDSGDFGDVYPDYRWTREITQVRTNGLFQVEYAVYRQGGDLPNETHMTVLFYRPDSPSGQGFGTAQ